MTVDPQGGASDVFSRVLRGILRPLVRALIARGMTAPALYRLIKKVYVEVADAEFSLDDKRQTDSRISVLTGVHRRDVREYRAESGLADTAVEAKVTVITSVLGRWLAHGQTTGDDGRPHPLARSGRDGMSFDALVASVSKDVRPRTVLDEMVRQRLVTIDDAGLLHLDAEAFVGPKDIEQKIFFFGENVGDHIAAATDNLLSDTPRFLERAVFYNRLTTASVDEIETAARTISSDALNTLNRLGHEKQRVDVSSGQGDERFRFGIFFYRTSDDAPEGEAEDRSTTGETDAPSN